MSLGTIESLIDAIQVLPACENIENSTELVYLEINWKNDYIYFVHSDDKGNILHEPVYQEIEKSFYNDSKEILIKELLDKIRKFSLLNIGISITICDIDHPEDDKTIFKTKSCQTFCEKICDLTELHKSKMVEIIVPEFGAELYFFVKSNNEGNPIDSLMITSNTFSSTAVNSFFLSMITLSKNLDNVSFIGKVGSNDHGVLKQLSKVVLRKLVNHVDKYDNFEADDSKTMFIDLTDLQEYENIEMDEDVLCYLNTSDIFETDCDLVDFYDNGIHGIIGDWDTQVEIDTYYNKLSFDGELMQKFLRDVELKAEENKSSTCNLEIIECDTKTQSKPSSHTRNTMPNVSTKRPHASSNHGKPRQSMIDVESFRQEKLRRASVEKGKIKSKLFNDEEIEKWTNSKHESKSVINTVLSALPSCSKVTSFDNSYKIPKLTPIGPSPRRPIHETQQPIKRGVTREALSNRFMQKYVHCVNSIVPYNSPSGSRITPDESAPSSISKFIDSESETCIVVDDDDDNNNDNNSKASQNDYSQEENISRNGQVKRRLLALPPKIFKNRKTEINTPPSNPFASRLSHRRKY